MSHSTGYEIKDRVPVTIRVSIKLGFSIQGIITLDFYGITRSLFVEVSLNKCYDFTQTRSMKVYCAGHNTSLA